MPKIPDKYALGTDAPTRSGRSYLNASDFDTGADVARGVKSLGRAAGKLSEMAVETAREDDALDLMRADLHKRTHILEAERSFDTDTNYDSYGQRFDVASKAIDQGASELIRNPKTREKWLLKEQMQNETSKNRLLDQALARKRDQRVVEVEGVLDKHKANYANPNLTDDDRAKIESDMDAAVGVAEKSAMISPQQAFQLRNRYIGGAVQEDYENRILKDPEKVIQELEGVPAPKFEIKPSPVQRGANIGRQRDPTSIKGVVVHETQGADTFEGNASWSNKKNTGANYYIDKTGAVIEWAPDNIAMNHAGVGRGTKGDVRPDLQNNNTLSVEIITRPGEKPNEAQKAALHALLKQKSGQYGFSSSDIEAHGRLAPGHKEVTEATDAVDFVRQNWDKEVQLADYAPPARTPTAMGKRGLTTYAQMDNGTATDAVASGDLPPANTGRGHLLTSAQRSALLDKARAALGADLTDKVNKDIIRIQAGLEPERGPDGRTSIERAETAMKAGAGYEKLRLKWEKAVKEREVIAPLERMSEDDAMAHIAGLRDSPWLQKAASEAWKKQMKLRDEDPASMVMGDKDVRTAGEIATKRAASVGLQVDQDGSLVMEDMPGSIDPQTKQSAVATILEARLQAQEGRGMPEYSQRILTRREAKNLLQIDSPTGMDDKKYRAALEAAAQRALDWYGPEYGKRALEEAIGFQRGSRTNDKKRFEDKLLASIAAGEGVSQADIRKYSEVSRTSDMMGREFEMQDPTQADDTRPYIGQPLQPTTAHIDWLKQNVTDPASMAAFDAKFGKGAAARALAAGENVQTTKDMNLPAPKQAPKSVLDRLFGN